MAELLKPCVSGVDIARVRALVRGLISPMPRPATTHAAMISAASALRAAVASARPMPMSTSTVPTRTAVTLDSRAPMRPCTVAATDQARAPPVSERPARVGATAYRSVSRYGM
ncbi:hypothetical protein SRABI76_02932 [Microbacterium oxydans]|nr:hypothetical protein SRABI76_02932 [Microbacterium oxydans]